MSTFLFAKVWALEESANSHVESSKVRDRLLRWAESHRAQVAGVMLDPQRRGDVAVFLHISPALHPPPAWPVSKVLPWLGGGAQLPAKGDRMCVSPSAEEVLEAFLEEGEALKGI